MPTAFLRGSWILTAGRPTFKYQIQSKHRTNCRNNGFIAYYSWKTCYGMQYSQGTIRISAVNYIFAFYIIGLAPWYKPLVLSGSWQLFIYFYFLCVSSSSSIEKQLKAQQKLGVMKQEWPLSWSDVRLLKKTNGRTHGSHRCSGLSTRCWSGVLPSKPLRHVCVYPRFGCTYVSGCQLTPTTPSWAFEHGGSNCGCCACVALGACGLILPFYPYGDRPMLCLMRQLLMWNVLQVYLCTETCIIPNGVQEDQCQVGGCNMAPSFEILSSRSWCCFKNKVLFTIAL